MSEQPTHAMLVRADDGLHLLPACTARVCAERTVTFSTGADVLGIVELYPEPIVGTRLWAHFQQHGRGPATAAELAAPARDARDDEISMLRDALDHIARSAHQSRSQTVRIRWIEARANGALEGKPYVRGQFREPKNGIAEFERMQSEILRMKAAQPVAGNHKLDTDAHVFFYEQDFYVLSNFSAFILQWKGRRFDTSEAAYHWEKFPDAPAVQDLIFDSPSAHEAFKLAERNKHLRRPDWDEVKIDVMREILRAKANQHEYVRRKLLATGDRILVEDSWRDSYWGWGPNRAGQNMLGKLWMEVRADLAAAPTTEPDDVPDPATNWADADAADYPGAVIEQEVVSHD